MILRLKPAGKNVTLIHPHISGITHNGIKISYEILSTLPKLTFHVINIKNSEVYGLKYKCIKYADLANHFLSTLIIPPKLRHLINQSSNNFHNQSNRNT